MADAPSSTNRLILVAPVRNEAEIIETFLARIHAMEGAVGLAGVVIVDDGSTDGTRARIEAFRARGQTRAPLRLVTLSRNFGHQTAVLAGLTVACEWASRDAVEFVAAMDADLQDRPEDLPALLAAAERADVAYAVRAKRREGWLFRVSARLFHSMLARHARYPIPAGTGVFSVMRLSVALAILENADRSPYFPGLRAWVGYRQVGVPLERDARRTGSSRVGILGLVQLAVGALFGYSDLPLKMMGIFGATALLTSIVGATSIIVLKLLGLVEVQGTALIITAIFFSLGVQSVYLMILTYILSRSASDASRKKAFLVMKDEQLP